MEYPKQEVKTGNSARATVCRRDIATIYGDAAPPSSGNPDYSTEVAADVLVEILEVSGGESVRGKQIEANVRFVVTMPWISEINLYARHKIEVGSGDYEGFELFTERVHRVHDRSRPRMLQLHCRYAEPQVVFPASAIPEE